MLSNRTGQVRGNGAGGPRIVHVESPARQRLEATVAALARLAREQQDIDSTLGRARGALAAEEEAQQALDALVAADDAKMAAWLEAGQGERPNPNTIARNAAAKRLREAKVSADGARSGMPGFEERAIEIGERAAVLRRQHKLALLGVALEEAGAVVRQYLRALQTASEAFGAVAAAEIALKEIAGQAPEGLRQLEDFLGDVPKLSGLAAADVDRTLAAWRRWTTELAHDPAADLLDSLL